jgi:hypothetical protein
MTTVQFVATRPNAADRIMAEIDAADLTVGETIWLVCIILEAVGSACDDATMRVMLDAVTSHVRGRPWLRDREQQLLEDEAAAAEGDMPPDWEG